MVTIQATSTLCTAHFPNLGILLPAGKPTPIPNDPAIIAAVKKTRGVVVEDVETTTQTVTTTVEEK